MVCGNVAEGGVLGRLLGAPSWERQRSGQGPRGRPQRQTQLASVAALAVARRGWRLGCNLRAGRHCLPRPNDDRQARHADDAARTKGLCWLCRD